MKTKFPKLRGAYTVTAIGSPILFFVAFLCLAGGRYGWAAVLCLIAIIFCILFPFRMVGKSPPKDRSLEENILDGLHHGAVFLLYCWLIYTIDLGALFQKIGVEHALSDWRPVIALGVWTGLAIYKDLRFINDLSDETIFNFLNHSDSK